MTYTATTRHLIAAFAMVLITGGGWSSEAPIGDPVPMTGEQTALVEFAVGRFEAQGLQLPDLDIVFHDSLLPCHGHKGLYRHHEGILEMCSLDKATMLHELAHAWANANLTPAEIDAFVARRGLPSWNDHNHAWERRGTEHVAETIAWALLDDPHHVKWVETRQDGSRTVTHRLLTVDADVDTLVQNFNMLTGDDPLFRHPAEWSIEDTPNETSPELARLAG